MSYGIKISPNITKVTAVEAGYPITVADVGKWLKLSTGQITLNTDVINDLIATAVDIAAKYTWLALRRTTYQADFDLGYNNFSSFLGSHYSLSLERAPIISITDITKIEYLDSDGVYQEFDRGSMAADGLYENTTEKIEQRDWASIYFRESVPFDYSRINAYKIRVTFISGFTDGDPTPAITDLPEALKTALLMMVAAYYTNRGDCSDCGCDLNGYPVPCPAKSILDQYSIAKTVIGGAYNPAGGGCLGGY